MVDLEGKSAGLDFWTMRAVTSRSVEVFEGLSERVTRMRRSGYQVPGWLRPFVPKTLWHFVWDEAHSFAQEEISERLPVPNVEEKSRSGSAALVSSKAPSLRSSGPMTG